MKTLLLVSSALVLGCTVGSAQTPATSGTAPAPAGSSTPPKHVLFQAPDDDSGGILPNRVGGGSRGEKGEVPSVEVLVPNHVALTTEARPLLYWYQSSASQVTCEVSVTEPKNPKPLMILQTSKPTSAGVHSFRVTSNLKPGVRYKWSVAIIADPKNRSQDVIAYGVIKRIDPSADLAGKLSSAADQDKPALYAQSGIWYDALESLSTQIQKAPDNQALKDERNSLLEQVGLKDAKFDAVSAKP